MKNFDLKQMGVQELSIEETLETQGGLVLAIIAVGLCVLYLVGIGAAAAQGRNAHTNQPM